ncbi:Glucose-fructose oxidoreductase [Nannochloropsis gaditana]|uniref:Glucose-fructose oxidoreductase n=1 Tax=Nannochloropsis gaditana TaxID=72520 RepID=W7TGS4_9STRA|nr:Glucose-fructose oxidoreductase [Nannochloropsis gaditana]
MSTHHHLQSGRRRLSSHHSLDAADDYVAGYAILGSASIARKLWKAMFMSGNSRVVCVASRDTARAQAFIDECQALLPFPQAPEAVEGYEAALARDDVQCVYIPLPTALRKEWVLKAAASGKHVLVEKPVGLNTEDVQEMIQACIKHNVHLMDGVMFMHSARLQLLQKTLPSLGPLRRINSEFCFKANEAFFQSNIRCSSATEPLGCLGDLGWYNIRLTLWAMNWYLPVRARGCVLKENADGVPYEFSGELLFESGCSATFFCSFLTHETQLAVLNGEEASVQYSDFVLPLPGRYLYFDVNHQSYQQEGLDQVVHSYSERHHVQEAGYGHPSAQEACMVRHLSDLSREGAGRPPSGPSRC